MYKVIKPALAAIFIFLVSAASAQQTLRDRISILARPANGVVGVSVLDLEDRDTVNYNGSSRMVMQSVMKFPIAMTVLHMVDSGVFTLDRVVHIRKSDMPLKDGGPLIQKYPKGGAVTISELLTDMVSYSDNNACDILLDYLSDDGPGDVMNYLHSIKIKGVNVSATEQDMAKAWELQYTDWCKPVDMAKLLDAFYNKKVLSQTSKDFLYKIMTETTTGPSATNEAKLTPATNDVGIITLPNGKHVAIAIFVCNSTADDTTRDLVIANIAKAVYDYEVKK